jgi:phosphoserine aminotransferase
LKRSTLLWSKVDSSDGFYKSKITDNAYRSRMNVILRIAGGNKDLEEIFIKEAKEAGIV